MDSVKNVLMKMAEDTSLKVSGRSIEQTSRNKLKKEIANLIYEAAVKAFADTDLIKAYRTADGTILAVDNEKIGMIPVSFEVSIKNLDVDPIDEEEAYLQKLADAKAKEEAKEKARREREAKIAEERALKLQLKELRSKNGE